MGRTENNFKKITFQTMRTIALILIITLTSSCADKKVDDETVLYYVIGSTHSNSKDTIYATKNQQADNTDDLLAQDFFNYKSKDHILKLFTSDNHAPIDGGRLYYTLDSIGIIYERSTTWPGFGRLKSNNDSINDLINQAFAHILQKPKLHCYQCRPIDTFVPPITDDK